MVCDRIAEQSLSVRSQPKIKSFRRLASTRGFERPDGSKKESAYNCADGWLRVHEGPQPFATSAQSRLVRVKADTTAAEVHVELGLNEDLSLWVQMGGGKPRQLTDDERPLRVQEELLKASGWRSAARRLRLSVDPELRHVLRWHSGPTGRRTGTLLLLKGLVFPQWKRRPAAIYGSQLYVYPAHPEGEPDVLELCEGLVQLCPAKAQRLVLQVKPKQEKTKNQAAKDNHIFLGFNTFWERNLWFAWLREATQCSSSVVSVSAAALGPLSAQAEAPQRVRELRLRHDALRYLPPDLLRFTSLRVLDLAENKLRELPAELALLVELEELRVEGNELVALGGALRPPRLRVLSAARNHIQDMETHLEIHIGKDNHDRHPGDNDLRMPLTTVDLRDNRLKGTIILGNYEQLSELDVSDNGIERLQLGALSGLRELRCARNRLREVVVHGATLVYLNAANNNLEKLVAEVPPANLTFMDVCHNSLRSLPSWLSACPDLTTLHATNNHLTTLPEHLFCSELSSLSSLRLAHNRITFIPSMPRLRAPLKELLLHNNCLHSLPDNFFSTCDRLCILNLSNNRLTRLPAARGPTSFALERLYLTANCLDDNVTDVIIAFRGLRVLHVAYNSLSSIPESCVSFWPDLEELVISGNRLERLPENLPRLRSIKVLRAHSNRLHIAPMFVNNKSIKVLDLAHNELDVINLEIIAPKQLKFLDISCNKKLQVDPMQFHAYQCQRPMSLVDVSGQNRISLPWQQRSCYNEDHNVNSPWKLGFSETPGEHLRLCITQLRLPSFCSRDGLFGIIDGKDDSEIAKMLHNSIPALVLEERAIKETANEYMRYVILSAHRELKEKGQKNGASLIICHISHVQPPETGFGPVPKKFILRMANVGDTKAVLSRKSGPLCLGSNSKSRIGYYSQYPNIVSDPELSQTVLQEDDEFLILGSNNLWEAISIESAIEEVRAERNPILAAKRLQDLAQSYGVTGSVSAIVLRFDNTCSDVDLLMRELRQTIRNNKTLCRTGCCCDHRTSCCHSVTIMKPGSDRSSPSGQSDQAHELLSPVIPHYASVRSNRTTDSSRKGGERRSCRGVARAIRVRVEEEKEKEKDRDKDDTDSAVSEEQFKCWEYMLEQNTQLLFDKELDTLSKGFSHQSKTSGLRSLKGLSGSSPQLSIPAPPTMPSQGVTRPSVPFLSKHFGSARSFGANSIKSDLRLSSSRVPIGGPNAAYFGSLQRLMPYHLEYDFAVIQERAAQSQDSLDVEGRMQQYWGVATTEL